MLRGLADVAGSLRRRSLVEIRRRETTVVVGEGVFVDGSYWKKRAGWAVYYGPGHKRNQRGRIETTRGGNNVAELAALFVAVRGHPRNEVLTIYTDSAAALNAAEAGTSKDGPPAPYLAALVCGLLHLRTARTILWKLPAHSNIEPHDLADALARRGAEHGDLLDLPAAAARIAQNDFYLSNGLRPFFRAWFSLLAASLDYVLGKPKTKKDDPLLRESFERKKAVAIDCERILGVDGSEIPASVVVVDESGAVLVDAFIRPDVKVIDYRTPLSGITHVQVSRGLDVRRVRRIVSSALKNKIVVGHGVAKDLAVLGLPYRRSDLRDTALYFRCPQTRRRRKLKDVARDELGLEIQLDDQPHCPKEDALAAMSLYLKHKIEFDKFSPY